MSDYNYDDPLAKSIWHIHIFTLEWYICAIWLRHCEIVCRQRRMSRSISVAPEDTICWQQWSTNRSINKEVNSRSLLQEVRHSFRLLYKSKWGKQLPQLQVYILRHEEDIYSLFIHLENNRWVQELFSCTLHALMLLSTLSFRNIWDFELKLSRLHLPNVIGSWLPYSSLGINVCFI